MFPITVDDLVRISGGTETVTDVMNDTFFSAVMLLLLVADPFGNVPIFVSALRDVPPQRAFRSYCASA